MTTRHPIAKITITGTFGMRDADAIIVFATAKEFEIFSMVSGIFIRDDADIGWHWFTDWDDVARFVGWTDTIETPF